MDNSKLSTFEAIAVILTVTLAHSVLTLPKAIMSEAGSSVLLNIAYISVIAFVFCLVIYKLLSKFPGSDIIDISKFLGGKLFQRIAGFGTIAYILFTSSVLLRIFGNCLKIVYYPMTDLVFIISIFVIAIPIACNLKGNSVFKANLAIVPIVMFSVVFLFIANSKYFHLENIYPIFGNGLNETFGIGITNLFAFGGIAAIYFLPPMLKNKKQLKKVAIVSVIISAVYFLLTIATILFMFSPTAFTNELMPLYSAVRYIEFGTFFERQDSIFLLIWILSFFCYLGIVFNFCTNIFKKVTNLKSGRLVSYLFALLALGCSLLPKNESVTNFLEGTVYRYLFLILPISIYLVILVLASFKNNKIKAKR